MSPSKRAFIIQAHRSGFHSPVSVTPLHILPSCCHMSLFLMLINLVLINIQYYIDDGNDDASCVLLDHIPHNDCCNPSLFDPSTYTQYAITINIPNVICERCSLHLSNPMTDKMVAMDHQLALDVLTLEHAFRFTIHAQNHFGFWEMLKVALCRGLNIYVQII